MIRAGPTWQLITAELILTDRQPEEQDGSTVSAPEGPLQHFNLAWLWFLAGLGNSELRMSSMGPELALDPSSGTERS